MTKQRDNCSRDYKEIEHTHVFQDVRLLQEWRWREVGPSWKHNALELGDGKSEDRGYECKGKLELVQCHDRSLRRKTTYEYNGDDCENHDGFGLHSRGYGFISTDSRFEDIGLLLFEIQKILEL